MRIPWPASTLIAAFALLTGLGTATAAPEIWTGPVWEHDDYVPANPIYNVHTSCDSTVGYAALAHRDAVWRFYAFADNCVGFDTSFRDDQCTTDGNGALQCSETDANGSITTMSFTTLGHVMVDYWSHAAFEGDHYHVEGDLTRA